MKNRSADRSSQAVDQYCFRKQFRALRKVHLDGEGSVIKISRDQSMCIFVLRAGKSGSGDRKRFGFYIEDVISLFFVVDCGAWN